MARAHHRDDGVVAQHLIVTVLSDAVAGTGGRRRGGRGAGRVLLDAERAREVCPADLAVRADERDVSPDAALRSKGDQLGEAGVRPARVSDEPREVRSP